MQKLRMLLAIVILLLGTVALAAQDEVTVDGTMALEIFNGEACGSTLDTCANGTAAGVLTGEVVLQLTGITPRLEADAPLGVVVEYIFALQGGDDDNTFNGEMTLLATPQVDGGQALAGSMTIDNGDDAALTFDISGMRDAAGYDMLEYTRTITEL